MTVEEAHQLLTSYNLILLRAIVGAYEQEIALLQAQNQRLQAELEAATIYNKGASNHG